MPTPDAAPTPVDGIEILARAAGATIAYHRLRGAGPGIVFLGGFRSDMTGTKALFLEDYCRRRGRAYMRFDYFAHGKSSGEFADGTISRWRDDAVSVIDSLTEGPQVLVGSSMGGWIMVLAALARPERVAALVGIAAAPDFTTDLLPRRLDAAQQRELRENGRIVLPSLYDAAGYLYTRALVEDGDRNLVLRDTIPLRCPVRLLHGMADESAPWRQSLKLAEQLQGADVALTLIKDGDHRLSRDEDLGRLAGVLDALSA
ncbi:MAG TPA: alpha/beta hydrolase [Stellaceae bacterium]|nr:alpha/beta hydrolase [Stellaceae bacterium]